MTKDSLSPALLRRETLSPGIFTLEFDWPGPAPRAGQFFMVKPRRSSVFLPRPISVFRWLPAGEGGGRLSFLIALRGRGTGELADLRSGEEAELTGPLGSGWADFLPPPALPGESPPFALVGGGMGLAPLSAFAAELPEGSFVYYAGFRSAPQGAERAAFLGAAPQRGRLVMATEDGTGGFHGRIPGVFDPRGFSAVFTCGPEAMMKAVALKCQAAGTPCFVSLERRMACGVGACLGCAVATVKGKRRCCTEGPVFPAGEILFDG
jgi:NAD(P)H-flavin reductase